MIVKILVNDAIFKSEPQKISPNLASVIQKISSKQHLFLEESCNLLKYNLFERGKKLSLADFQNLKKIGFHSLWITSLDPNDPKSQNHFFSNLKQECYQILKKSISILNEKKAQKPGSQLNYMNPNDLLKRTIEPIQSQGTRYLAEAILGQSYPILKQLESLVQTFLQNPPTSFPIFSNLSLGSLQNQKSNRPERSNYIIEWMINNGFAFMTTLANIQKNRDQIPLNTHSVPLHKRKKNTRYAYSTDELLEASLAAFFSEYGHLHSAVDHVVRSSSSNTTTQIQQPFLKLNPNSQNIYDKHCNTSFHFFNSIPQNASFVQNIARGILQYHHSALNGTGYPPRKIVTQKISKKNSSGFESIQDHKIYEYPLLELTRLAHIVNFFVEYSSHTFLHWPFNRDSIIRHLLINSIFPKNDSGQYDHDGIFELDTQDVSTPYSFDGFLVQQFLQSVQIYKIGEIIPIYQFDRHDQKLDDATILQLNPQAPHRPIIRPFQKNQDLDLSLPQYESIYIGEYIPALHFQDVLDSLNSKHPCSYSIQHQTLNPNFKTSNPNPSTPQKPLQSNHILQTTPFDDADIDELLMDIAPEIKSEIEKSQKNQTPNPNPKPTQNQQKSPQLFPISFNHQNQKYPYALALLTSQNSNQKQFQITHLARFTHESLESLFFSYSPVPPNPQLSISIPHSQPPSFHSCQFTAESSLPKPILQQKISKPLLIGHYYFLLYFQQLDPKKNPSPQKTPLKLQSGTPKYIVCIKNLSKEQIILHFVRYVRNFQPSQSHHYSFNKDDLVKDKNCGKNFDLNRFPFFKIGPQIPPQKLFQSLQIQI